MPYRAELHEIPKGQDEAAGRKWAVWDQTDHAPSFVNSDTDIGKHAIQSAFWVLDGPTRHRREKFRV
jgi:hypothetical protein